MFPRIQGLMSDGDGKKKLSGAQSRKRKLEKEVSLKKNTSSIKKFFVRPGPSSDEHLEIETYENQDNSTAELVTSKSPPPPPPPLLSLSSVVEEDEEPPSAEASPENILREDIMNDLALWPQVLSDKQRIFLMERGPVQFHSVTDKRSQNTDCGENSMTIVTEKKVEDDASESSSGENVDIEDKSLPIVEPALESTDEGHAAQCPCPNCDEVLSRFSECSICLEPLQCCGPCVCPWCGGVWCARCSRRMSRCAWCRGSLRAPAAPCLALQRLVNDLMLPCRNYRRGCTELLTATIRAKHEEECKYDTMICPITPTCCSVPFEELSAHLQSNHNIIAVYSQKIKILIENFQTKLKKTACCRTKYKIILLYQKSAFIIKVCIYNYHVKVEVMRRKLGYIADAKSESKKSDYCALIEFQSKALCTKSAILIENEAYSKKAEVQWNDVILKSENDEAITIHVNIGKSDAEQVRKEIADS